MSYPANPTSSSEQDQRRLTPAVLILIAINVAVMFLQMTMFQYSDMAGWFGFDASSLPTRWWTVVTYMFVHVGIWHLLANMYGLYLFGPRLERTWSTRKFTWFYLICGLGGVLLELVIRKDMLVGASAAVFGVMTAYALQWPDDEVYLLFVMPMRVRTLAFGLLVFNLVMGIAATGGSDGGGTNFAYLAQLGGVIVAYIYVRMGATPGIDQVRQRVANLPDPDEPPRAIPRNMPRRERGDEVDDIVAKSKAIAAKRPVALPVPGSRRREAKADELNRVLDKISEHGIESLTREERRLLEEASKRLQNGD